MKFIPLSLLSALAIIAGTAGPVLGQGNLEKAPKLRLPPYSSTLLELTAARLDQVEQTLQSLPDVVAEEKASSEYHTARGEWERCEQGMRSSRKASPKADAPAAAPEAQGQANAEEQRRRAAEFLEKMKKAKSQEEMQKIIQEMQGGQQGAAAQVALANQAAQVNEEYDRQVTAKCGPKPAAPKAKEAESPQKESTPGMGRMLERTAGYCRQKMHYVGPDGAVSPMDTPYRDDDKGNRFYNVEVYSPAEAKLLGQRCSRLKPLLASRGYVMDWE
ncbi:MAG: hypothetical protein ACREMZ_15590 [Gemmatimonadales bacterium]